MALRTTVVGSWWKLDEHEDQLARYHRGELDPEQGDDLLNRAAAAAIDEQRALGLDEWTGGEYFTDNFIDHMQRVLHGFEIDKPDEPDPFDYDDLAHAVIMGELSAPRGTWVRRRLPARVEAARRSAEGDRGGPARDHRARTGPARRARAPDAEPGRHRQPRDPRVSRRRLPARSARRAVLRDDPQRGSDEPQGPVRDGRRVL